MVKKLIFLGTNGWYDTKTGNGICTLLLTDNYALVFDAGTGIYKLDKYVKRTFDVYVLVSHLHLDHIVGLHLLGKFDFLSKLHILVHEENIDYLNTILNVPYTLPLTNLRYSTFISSIQHNNEKLPFILEWKTLKHTVLTTGFRVTFGNKSVVYCPDTAYCKEAIELARDVDVLIAECAYLPGECNSNWPHLNPESAARIARKARAKTLFLTHFDASRYISFDLRKVAERTARKIFENTYAAYDDLIFSF